mgnify:CR=1 FL=1
MKNKKHIATVEEIDEQLVLNDPDAFGRESVQLDNCWFNELPI